MKTDKIENFLKNNGFNYTKNKYSINIYGYKDKYSITIDLQFKSYLMVKYIDNSYVCKIDCKTQRRVIEILSLNINTNI